METLAGIHVESNEGKQVQESSPILVSNGLQVAKYEKINNLELVVKVYQNQRVITFKDIDAVHERPEGTARRNFNTNKKHFLKGEDFFQRNSLEAQNEFRILTPNGLILITESGYLMLVKSFTDDLAWQVQRQLVKNYFRKPQRLYWQQTRQQTKDSRLLETECIKEFVAYAKEQGSQHAERYYCSFTRLANKAAGITYSRENATIQQLNNLSLIEHIIEQVLRECMQQGKPYKEIYLDCKARVEQFQEIAYLSTEKTISKIK